MSARSSVILHMIAIAVIPPELVKSYRFINVLFVNTSLNVTCNAVGFPLGLHSAFVISNILSPSGIGSNDARSNLIFAIFVFLQFFPHVCCQRFKLCKSHAVFFKQ